MRIKLIFYLICSFVFLFTGHYFAAIGILQYAVFFVLISNWKDLKDNN